MTAAADTAQTATRDFLADPCPGCADATVSVVVPCHNEVLTIGAVIEGFRKMLPQARLLIADNLSTDGTAEAAITAGAEVIKVPIPGKGRAVRRLLETCTSEVVVMVDGDATYDPSVAPLLVHTVMCEGFDLVNVSRIEALEAQEAEAYRGGHKFGNWLLTSVQRTLTGVELRDILTGYKAMSRRFVTSLPVRSQAFQLEVEIASHAVALDFAYTETPAHYFARPEGSSSKLSTYKDGTAILRTILRLHRDLHPFAAFGVLATPWFLVSLLLVIPPVLQFFQTHKVPKYPSLIAGVAAFIVGMLLLTSGWILERTRGVRRDLLLVAANDLERQMALLERR